MIVTFISECEKKALKKTRRVLDAFADRIGSNAWQTVITEEGLDAVKTLLKNTATKNTAVSCHRIKSRVRTELQWIVGNKNKFNPQGNVPVNTTQTEQFIGEKMNFPMNAIQALTAIAALFHDMGKASNAFQKKLNQTKYYDYYRHEWISVVLFSSFVNSRKDNEWIQDGIENKIHQSLTAIIKKEAFNEEPLKNLPPIAQMIAWLILSHHKLPTTNTKNAKSYTIEDFSTLENTLDEISEEWGYDTNKDKQTKADECHQFKKGLPSTNPYWQLLMKRNAMQINPYINELTDCVRNGNSQLILTLSRTCLILADHFYSSLSKEDNYRNNLAPDVMPETELYANTRFGTIDQPLEEHLIGVAKSSILNCNKITELSTLPTVENNKEINTKSTGIYQWQDKAVTAIKEWRKTQTINIPFGFFGINIASTGTGKTTANAKIMQALSPQSNSLRYILALGLRTLTLQTGDEYRDRIKLSKEELAVIIGSKAMIELHNNQKEEDKENNEIDDGSESREALFENDIKYNGVIDNQGEWSTILERKKARKLLFAPVLACTIDHIIGATETTRGGKHILPIFRLLSSDLVIDEVDDFEPEDLVSIGRLIHLTAMLGKKVLLSSATITPDIAEGFYKAYQAGWKIYTDTCKINSTISCFWSDEFKSKCETINNYSQSHNKFIQDRQKKLNQQPIKRQPYIAECPPAIDSYFPTIQENIIRLHNNHFFIDPKTKKRISLGVVRMANIKPCINLTKYLLGSQEDNSDYDIKSMAYHSQQLLIMRHSQEEYLDKILKRKDPNAPGGNKNILNDDTIRKHIDDSKSNNILFVVVATPVEEVGRDHDFDWCVIEPSSIRSIIQMAGRVFRHRTIEHNQITPPNIAILQYNYRFLKNSQNIAHIPFCRPGFQRQLKDLNSESKELFQKYNLHNISNYPSLEQYTEKGFTYRIDASERMQKENNSPLGAIEHKLLKKFLQPENSQELNNLTASIDQQSYCWMTGLSQQLHRFRSQQNDEIYYLYDNDFYRKDPFNKMRQNNEDYDAEATNDLRVNIGEHLNQNELANLWLRRDYKKLLKEMEQEKTAERKTARTFGEITIRKYEDKNGGFYYSPHLGLWKDNQEQ
jgi:CRISPR-associated endonuclease/helicase Cas3